MTFTHCRQCGRKVKHPIAVKFGVGRVCAKKIQMTPNPYLQECFDDQAFTYAVLFKRLEEPAHKFFGNK